MEYYSVIKKMKYCPGQCGSVGWASSCKGKGHQFDFCLGHMSGLWAWSPGGACVSSNQLMFLSQIDVSLFLFLPPFPSL